MPEEPASDEQGHRGPAHAPDRTGGEPPARGPRKHDAPDPLSIAASAMAEADTSSAPPRKNRSTRAVDPLAVLRDALGDDVATEAESDTGTNPTTSELPDELVTLAEAADEPVPLQPRRRGTFARRTPPDAPAEAAQPPAGQAWQEIFEPEPYAGAHAASREPDPIPDGHTEPVEASTETPAQPAPVVPEPEAAPIETAPAEPSPVEAAPEATQADATPVEAAPEETAPVEAAPAPQAEAELESEAVADHPTDTAADDEATSEVAPQRAQFTPDTGEVTREWDVAELQATVWGPLTHIDEPIPRSSEVTPMSEPTASSPDEATGFETPADLLAGYTAANSAGADDETDGGSAESATMSTPAEAPASEPEAQAEEEPGTVSDTEPEGVPETGPEEAAASEAPSAESTPGPVQGELWSEPDVDTPEAEGGLWKGLRRRWHRSDAKASRAAADKTDGKPGGAADGADMTAEGIPEEPAADVTAVAAAQNVVEPTPADATPPDTIPADAPDETVGPGYEPDSEPAGEDDAVATEPTTEPGVEPNAESTAESIAEDEGFGEGVGDTTEYQWTAANLAAGGWSTDDLRGAGWTDEQLIAVGWDPEANGPAAPAVSEDEPGTAEPARDTIAEADPGCSEPTEGQPVSDASTTDTDSAETTEQEPEQEPEATATPTAAEVTPKTNAETNAAAADEDEGAAQAVGASTDDAEAAPSGEEEAADAAVDEQAGTTAESGPEAEAELDAESETEVETEVESETATAAEPETTAHTDGPLDDQADDGADDGADDRADVQGPHDSAGTDPEADPADDQATGADEAESEAAPETGAETGAETGSEVGAEADSDLAPETGIDAGGSGDPASEAEDNAPEQSSDAQIPDEPQATETAAPDDTGDTGDDATATPENENSEIRADFSAASTGITEETAADTAEEAPTGEPTDAVPDNDVSADMDQPAQRPQAQPTAPATPAPRVTTPSSDFDFVFDDDPIELETYDIEAPLASRQAASAPSRPVTPPATPTATPTVAPADSPTAPAAEAPTRPAPRETSEAPAVTNDDGGDDESDRAAAEPAPDQPAGEPDLAVPDDPTTPDSTGGPVDVVTEQDATEGTATEDATTGSEGEDKAEAEDDGDDEDGGDDTPDGGTPAAPDSTPPSLPGAPVAEAEADPSTTPGDARTATPAPETTTDYALEQPARRAPWFHDEPAVVPQPFWTSLIDDSSAPLGPEQLLGPAPDAPPAAEPMSPSSPSPPEAPFPAPQSAGSPISPARAREPASFPTPAVAADDSPPAYVEYRPSNARRWVLGGLFLVAAVLAVVTVFYAVQQGTGASVITAVSVIVLACALWWGLISWAPRIITISDGTLEVAQGPNSERFDLTSSRTEIELGDDPRARSWTAEVVRPNGSRLVIRSSQVRPQQFTELVGRYRPTGTTPVSH